MSDGKTISFAPEMPIRHAQRARRYVNPWSQDGHEVMARALEIPSVRSIAGGKLKVDDILGMTEEQTACAFGIIRWSESGGLPTCPKCRMDAPYWLGDRGAWKCRACHHQFSMTSGTLLSSRKVPFRNYLFALSLVLDKSQFSSLLEFTRELGLSYKSAHATYSKIRTCATDSDGCTVPFSLLERTAWTLRRNAIRSNLRALVATPALNYPYMRNESRSDGSDLVEFANSIVPKGLPDYVRADICQDIIVSILAGEASREQVSQDAKRWITKVLQASPWKFKWMSFDAPLGAEDSARSLHDLMAAPEGASFDEAVAVTQNDARERARVARESP